MRDGSGRKAACGDLRRNDPVRGGAEGAVGVWGGAFPSVAVCHRETGRSVVFFADIRGFQPRGVGAAFSCARPVPDAPQGSFSCPTR